MFQFKKKEQTDPYYLSRLDNFCHLVRSHPIRSENFLDSFNHFSKLFNAEAASLYIYEQKTNMFLLKKWYGQKPSRFSISGDFEFINHLKVKGMCIHRKEFSQKTLNELRQPALLYFQHTVSNTACPLVENGEWFGILNMQVNLDKPEHEFLLETILEFYSALVKSWMQYQTVAQHNKKLSEVSHVKNQLLANVTHEFHTPLNGILGVSEALLDDGELSDEHKNSIRLIKKSGDDLHKTVNNILELVQIEAQKNKNIKAKVDVLELIKEVVMLYSDASRVKAIGFVIPKSEDSVFVYVQQDQIRTVFMNLIGNAVKFTDRGEIRIAIKKNGERLHVIIDDTGIGIDEDKINLIFEEFYQADGSHTRMYGGTGLGLAIVKKIISLHGGRIWVESQKGKGTSVQFTLPMYPV